MTRPVFFLDSASDLVVGASCVLDGPEGHHAVAVRRVRVGEQLVLTDGRGARVDVEVSTLGRRHATCLVLAARHDERDPLRVTVVQAIPKGDRGELAVELLTEIGVNAIVPWQAERCVSRWEGPKADRGQAKWGGSAREAAKQSRHTWWPVMAPLADTAAVVDLIAGADAAWVLHEAAADPFAAVLANGARARSGNVVLVVGPEGGISDPELETLATAGATAVRLGPSVLRTSTAGVVAATLVMAGSASWGRSVSDRDRGEFS